MMRRTTALGHPIKSRELSPMYVFSSTAQEQEEEGLVVMEPQLKNQHVPTTTLARRKRRSRTRGPATTQWMNEEMARCK